MCLKHWDGIPRSRLSRREGISGATVERWFVDFLRLRAAERSATPCPQVLGIDEHFFTRRQSYVTTLWRFPRNHAITEDKLTDFATSKTTV